MLDDEDGVAEVAEAAQRCQQAVVVALVEADARLVEDVKDAGEAGPDLAGEADALALAARQRARLAVEVQIFEADVVEEAEALDDLLHDALGDGLVLRGELGEDALGPLERLGDGAAGGVGDGLARDLHRQRLGPEAGAVADLAGLRGLVAGIFLLDPRALGVAPALLDIGDDALERLDDLVGLAAVLEAQGDGVLGGAVKDGVGRAPAADAPTGRTSRRRSGGPRCSAPAGNRRWAGWTWPTGRRRPPTATDARWGRRGRGRSTASRRGRRRQGRRPAGR